MSGGAFAQQFDSSSIILNFNACDPFEEQHDTGHPSAAAPDLVHLRWQQRNGRKSLTIIEGLSDNVDHERLLRRLKKELCCNGHLIRDEKLGTVIQLQGDQRQKVRQFLLDEGLVEKDKIRVHG